jgi:hypothetical protein
VSWRAFWIAFALLVCAGCSRTPASRCERVCLREGECHDRMDLPGFNATECVEQCQDLERQAPRVVEEHIACVDKQTTCAEVVECP